MLSQGSSMGAADRCKAIELSGEAVPAYVPGGPLSPGASLGRLDPHALDQWVSGRNAYKADALRILVVDGDATVRELMVQWLEDMGGDAVAVASGSEAISAGEAGCFDLVFLDLMMPRGSAGKTLRNLKRVNREIKAILLTAHLERGLMEAALEMGPVTILKKPLIKEVLQDIVASLSVHKSAQSSV
jgi:CheY-like chemotaxis protein